MEDINNTIICKNCLTPSTAASRFCKKCGAALIAPVNGVGPGFSGEPGTDFNPGVPYGAGNGVPPAAPKVNGVSYNAVSASGVESRLVEPDEYVVASLENGLAQNVLKGEGLKKESIFITQKRLYLTRSMGILSKQKVNDVIELRDISATKLLHTCNWWWLAVGILAAVGFCISTGLFGGSGFGDKTMKIGLLIAFAVSMLFFLLSRNKRFTVEYAGGSISIRLRDYQMKNMLDFQKAIHRYKCRPENAVPENK